MQYAMTKEKLLDDLYRLEDAIVFCKGINDIKKDDFIRFLTQLTKDIANLDDAK